MLGEREIEVATAARPGMTGASLLPDNLGAFAARVASARRASRALDLMYYYWRDDITGNLLMHEVLGAADRGVRVRILLDDINVSDDRGSLALDRHPNIELRLFNPALARNSTFERMVDLALRAAQVTRRMHNKAWIADGRLAIVGGRNIGDAYFDAARSANFRDLDVALIGTAVTEACEERFWNCAMALRVRTISTLDGDLAALRRKLDDHRERFDSGPYGSAINMQDEVASLRQNGFCWTDRLRIVADPPEKAAGRRSRNWLGEILLPVIAGARHSVEIISPYFIPGRTGMRTLIRLVASGVRVTVSTNSLAATDVTAVHGSYAKYRKRLVAAGVHLFELRPEALHGHKRSLFGSRGASLHTKAFTVDDRWGFVGSFNFDPRSYSLNTEMGVLFDHEELAGELSALLERQTSADESYRVRLEKRRLVWDDGEKGRIWRQEPEAGIGRRLAAWLIAWLPLESQL